MKPLLITLAVDTSSPNLTFALWKGSRLAARKDIAGAKGKTHLLAFYLSEMLKEAKLEMSDIDRVGFGLGPGSYTGLRIGLASLKALRLTQKKLRAFGFSSLDLTASGISKTPLGVAVDARREKIYVNFYRSSNGKLERHHEYPMLLAPNELVAQLREFEVIHLAGDALIRYGENLKELKNCHLLDPSFWYPKAKYALPLVTHEEDRAADLELKDIRPIYMRRSEAEEKWGLCYDQRDLERNNS